MPTKYNEKRANPNENFTFISTLNGWPNQGEAYKMLSCLAAQVKPIMREHGFKVMSLEEYEPNTSFWGRNWNAGEVIELVLRWKNGAFLPFQMIVGVLCHELSHIKHMNHAAGFQRLNSQLREEVNKLQAGGYFGDGFYSGGKHLGTGIDVAGDSQVKIGDMPELLCGGARIRNKKGKGKAKSKATKGTKEKGETGKKRASSTPSKPRKKRRTKVKGAFSGVGRTLADGGSIMTPDGGRTLGTSLSPVPEDIKKSRKKWAHSKKEKEARAEAIEKRLRALQGSHSPDPVEIESSESETEYSDSDTDDSSDDGRDEYQPTLEERRLAEVEKWRMLGLKMPDNDAVTVTNGTAATSINQSATSEKSPLETSKTRSATSSPQKHSKSKSASSVPATANSGDSVPSTSSASDSNTWMCFCTTVNHIDYGACTLCETLRSDAEKANRLG